MGAGVLLLGRSGAGKTYSLHGFGPDEIGLLNVTSKEMPFRSSLPSVDGAGYDVIKKCIGSGKRRAWFVDDANYLMAFDNFARAGERGYDKFTDMACDFEGMLKSIRESPKGTIVYVAMHTDIDALGREKPKTIGKMLDEKLCIEGLFSCILDCTVQDGRHVFVTESNGVNLAKAPVGCLPPVMDNDLKAVDTALREYWGLAPLVDTEKKENGNAKG